MPESVKDLTVRLSFEHGDTKSQIQAIKNEIKLLDSGFQAAAVEAGGFSSSLDETRAKAQMLQQQVQLQQQAVQRYGVAIQEASKKVRDMTALHEKEGQKLQEARAKRDDLKSQIKELTAAMDAERAAGGENSQAYQEMAEKLSGLQKELEGTDKEIKGLERSFAASEKKIINSEKAVQKFTAAQNLAKVAEGQLREQLSQTEARLKSHADAWQDAEKKLRGFAEAAENAGKNQVAAGKRLSKVSAGILAAGVAAGKAAIDWESSFAGVRKTVSGTDEQLAQLEETLLSMEVPTDFDELADIAAGAGQLGIATENVAGFTRTMADLSETTDLTADAAATAFAQYANITGMPQENIARLGSVTVELGNNLATTESKIVDFATAIAAAGRQAGMTDQQIFGIAGGLSSLGLEAQAGGTAFSRAIVGMQVAVETGSEDLENYARVAGMTSEQFKQAFSEDAAGTFIRFVEGLSSGSESAIVMLDQMGVTETRLRDTLLRASGASDLMVKSINMANSAWTANTALTNEASVRYNTTASRMQMVGKNAQRVAMDFGKSLLPILEKGMDAVSGVTEKFSALDESQREGIIKWALYAAAVGPALTTLGKANNLIGGVAGKIADFAGTMAKGAAEGGGLLKALSGLMGPAGMAGLAVGALYAGYKLLDMASGAKAAREAVAALNAEAKSWVETQATTLYDTGNGDPLSLYGLTKSDFTGQGQETLAAAESWMDELVKVWTDGKSETNEIVKQFTEGFTSGSDDVRKAMEEYSRFLSKYDALTPQQQAAMEADLEQLEAWDDEVAALLKKRQNGYLTEEEQARLKEILEKRSEIELKYSFADASDGYDKIVTGMQAAVERARANGGDASSEVYGNAMNALVEGRRAYLEAVDQSYDAEYAQIQLIEDETARTEALMALNQRYNEQRAEGQAAYDKAVREAGVDAWKAGGYTEQVEQVRQLAALMGDLEGKTLPEVQAAFNDIGLDEGQLTSMLALVEQLKAAGMSNEQLLNLGIDYDGLMTMVEGIRDIAQKTEGLEGIAQMFGEALPQEIQRVLVGLDMTQAAQDWAEFAEGGSLEKIKAQAEIGEVDASAITVSGAAVVNGELAAVNPKANTVYRVTGASVSVDGTLGAVTGADGKTYQVTGATVTADGKLASVTTEDGVTYTVTDADVRADGTLASVTGADGVTYTVTGVKASVDGVLNTVTGADGATYRVSGAAVSVDGTLGAVTGADGVTYQVTGATVTADGKLASVTTEDGVTYTVTDADVRADGTLATVTGADGVTYTVTGVKASVDGELGTITGEDGKVYRVVSATVLADGTLATVTCEDGKTYRVENGQIVAEATLEGVDGEGKTYTVNNANITAAAKIKLNPLDRSAIAAFNANNSVNKSGLEAKVGVGLGSGWQGKLKEAFETGKLAVYGADGLPLDVTPTVVSQITAQDVCVMDEDGTLHVIITPEVGSEEAVTATREANEDNGPLQGTVLEWMSADNSKVMADISNALGQIRELKKELQELQDSGEMYNEHGMDEASLTAALNERIGYLASQYEGFQYNQERIEEIAAEAANLMAALESGELDPDKAAEYAARLQEVIDMITAAEEYTGQGESISEGISEGMARFGWTGTAEEVKAALQAAVDGSFEINSPAKAMIPTGEGVSEGIALGMTQFGFAAAAATVAANVTGAFGSMRGQGQVIGDQFGQGLQRGLAGRLPQIVSQARQAANQITQAFREAWDEHSPSRVAANLTEMFGAGLEKGMEHWPKVSERLLNDDLDALYGGVRRASDAAAETTNNNNSVNLNVGELKVNDRQDVESLAYEIAGISRRAQMASGHR